MIQRPSPVLLLPLLAVSLAGCAVGPNYARPTAPISATFKEADGWKQAEPSDAIDRGQWWTVFNDPALNALEAKVEVSNQNLIAAEAAYRQARALVAQDRASLFPAVDLTAGATRSKNAVGTNFNTLGGASTGTGQALGSSTGRPINQYSVRIGATWEPDIWGGIRRSIESASASAQASRAAVASARLSAQVELAVDYVLLRAADEQKRLIDQTVAGYARTLEITQNRYKVGVAARSEVLTAQTQLQTAQAQAVDVIQTRAQLEHAIAVLTGQAPGDFTLPVTAFSMEPPAVPVGLPSALLERRPDVAQAERAMASANAQIGVNVAGYFPALTLTGSDGGSSSALSNLFKSAANSWSLGASLAQTVFDAGATGARVAQARATYDQRVAQYRQTVLAALQQVEDSVAASRVLESERQLRIAASAQADEAERIVTNQYKAGQVDFTALVVAQNTALNARVSANQATANRVVASVDLISALGGGWRADR